MVAMQLAQTESSILWVEIGQFCCYIYINTNAAMRHNIYTHTLTETINDKPIFHPLFVGVFK